MAYYKEIKQKVSIKSMFFKVNENIYNLELSKIEFYKK